MRGLGSPLPHLHRDWAHPCHICTGAGLTPAASAPGLGSPWPHLHRDWAHPGHICTGTRHWHERVAICMLYVECGSGDAQRTEKQRREALEFDKKMRDKLLLRSQPQACCAVYGVWCIVAHCTSQMREKPRPRNEPRARAEWAGSVIQREGSYRRFGSIGSKRCHAARHLWIRQTTQRARPIGSICLLAGPVVMLRAAAPVLCVKLVLDTRVSMCDDAGDSGGPGRHEG